MESRTEKDSMGEMQVPKDAYFGAHTARSLENFQISSLRWHPSLLKAIIHLKIACAKANAELKQMDEKKAKAVVQAGNELLEGKHADQFPLDVFQAGSGTSTNMNVNEVIAHKATEILTGKREGKAVHPNDDVNKGQSTNDVIPASIRIACCNLLEDLNVSLTLLEHAFGTKAQAFADVIKAGRTHLQDAVPITLGQEFHAYATAVGKHRKRLRETRAFLKQLGIGGNAVGTGLNTPPEFRGYILAHLNRQIGDSFEVTPDGIESTQFLTDVAALSSVTKLIAIDLNKIANDIRLMASGPNTGFNEINLPVLEPGSSIMPGKVNPSICEAVNMVCYKVIGNDTTITMACSAGNLELNTHIPVIGHCILESLEILANATRAFAEKCITGITANKEQCKSYVEHSAALATALNPYLGYDKVAELVKESLKTGKSVKELAKKFLSQEELERILDPAALTQPGQMPPAASR